ncbi:MAG: efflux RND transporter periplasmic adaptor subunit [Prevotella sp.]|nr:efflux RND transporter periplasmic adaptor subunit [Prevotella sp.]
MKHIGIYSILMAACLMASCHPGEKHHGAHDHEGEENEDHSGEIVMTDEQMEKAGVDIETVEPGDFTAVMKAAGQIVRRQGDEQTVSATISGIVYWRNASLSEGSQVGSGQPLADITARHLQDGDPIAKAKAAFEAAKSEMERVKPLADENILSQREYEQARLNYQTAKAAYEGIAASKSGSAVVTTGMGGFIKSLIVKSGDYVNVGDPIAVVTQNRRQQLVVDVPECAYRNMNDIRSANFKATGNDNVYKLSELNGKLISYSRTLPEGSAYLPATFEFDNVGDIIAGSFVEVYLLLKQKQNVITVPNTSLTEEQGLYYVYVKKHNHNHEAHEDHEHEDHDHEAHEGHEHKGEEGIFEKREVKIGQTDGVRTEILSGLKAGECIVTEGAYQVKLAASSSAIPEGHNHNH